MIRIVFFAFLFIVFSTDTSLAQSYLNKDSVITKPLVYASAGVYFPRVTSRLRIDGERGLGSDITLEEGFGLNTDMSVFRVDGLIQASKKSQFVVSFTSLQRSNSFSVDEPVEIFDTIFNVNANLDFYFDTYYYALTWRYSIFNEVNWNAGVSVGLRAVQFKTGLDASFEERSFSASEQVAAPAILFGVHGAGYLTPKLLARYSLEYFQLSVVGINVRVIETRASVEYFFTKNIGLGLAYSTNEYLVEDIPLSDFQGKVLFEFGGFNLFASARF